MLLFHVTFTVSDHIFYIFHVVFLLPLHPLSCLCQTFNQKSWCVRACLTQTHTIIIIMIRTAFFHFFSLFLSHHSHLQSWPSAFRGFNLKNFPNYLRPHISNIHNRSALKLVSQSTEPRVNAQRRAEVTDKAESLWVHQGSQITVASHLLTCSYLPHFPTSTSLYFPLTLANLSRQWVAGIHFHPVVALESPFSKQHDITKTIAKGRF